MLRIDPETVPIIFTNTTRIPDRIGMTGTVMCCLSRETFGASDTMTVMTGMLAVTDVTDRTRVDMTRRGVGHSDQYLICRTFE